MKLTDYGYWCKKIHMKLGGSILFKCSSQAAVHDALLPSEQIQFIYNGRSYKEIHRVSDGYYIRMFGSCGAHIRTDICKDHVSICYFSTNGQVIEKCTYKDRECEYYIGYTPITEKDFLIKRTRFLSEVSFAIK